MPSRFLSRISLPVLLVTVAVGSGACGGNSTGPSGSNPWALPTLIPDQTYALAVSSQDVIASMMWLADTVVFRSGSTLAEQRRVGFASGSTPIHGVFSSDGSIFYVDLQSTDQVARVPVAGGAPTIVPIGHPPFNIARSESGDAVYVTTADSWVFRLNATTLAKLDSVQLTAAGSNGIDARGGQLWAATGDGKVFRLDPTTLTKLDSVTIGGALQRVILDPGATRLFVAAEGAGKVVAINTATKATTDIPQTGAPVGVALDPADGELWVAVRTAGMVYRFDGTTLAPLDSSFIGGTPRDVTFSKNGSFAMIGVESYSVGFRR